MVKNAPGIFDPDAVSLGTTETLLRQTIVFIERKDGTKWARISVTMPPGRTSISTLSLCLEDSVKQGVLATCETHFNTMWEIAKSRGHVVSIRPETHLLPFEYRNDLATNEWARLNKLAVDEMRIAEDNNDDSILIEVAAQHPLSKKGMPGKEFQKRLDKAIELYEEFHVL